jgi:pyridoxamine 5'-phosphate oxidase
MDVEPDREALAALRREYGRGGLAEDDLAPDPVTMFRRWFADARDAGLYEPNAMVLATVGGDGQASARAVLLKGYDDRGFVFYTNYESRKAREAGNDPLCALVFPWFELQRQVRVEGSAQRVERADSEAYFASRPRPAQLGAWASAQSTEVADRAALDAAYADAERRFAGVDVPCPPHWGGLRVVPAAVEFWQGRLGRMHDRLVYRRAGEDGRWHVVRLAP